MSEEVAVDVKSVEIELKHSDSSAQPPSANAANAAPAAWPAPATETVVIAFINFNSGGKMGEELTGRLQKVLGNDRVFNLADGGPKKGLTKWYGHPNLRIVIGGGDGTINWVLSSIRALYSSSSSASSAAAAAASAPPPPAGFIPLGTGNDTSRVFGWGFKYPGTSRIQHNVERMKTGGFAWFDRFHVSIEREASAQPPADVLKHLPQSFAPITNAREQFPSFLYQRPEELPRARFFVDTVKGEGEKKENELKADSAASEAEGNSGDSEEKARRMSGGTTSDFIEYSTKVTHAAEFNNYLSFGLDAQTMNGFHRCRENYRGCFPCRCCNMAWVGVCGARVTCLCQWRRFDVDVLVRDGEEWRKLQLPSSIRAVVLLNVWSYGGGRRPWGTKVTKAKGGEDGKQSMNDGLLEIIGIGSPMHMGFMMLHLTSGVKLAQAAEVKIVMRRPLHVQIDGEPWEDYPAVFHVRALPRARILVNEDVKQELALPIEPLGGITAQP